MSRAIHGLLRRRDGINPHLNRLSSPSSIRSPAPQDPSTSTLILRTQSKLFSSHSFTAKPTSSNGTVSRLFSSSESNPLCSMVRASRKYYTSAGRAPQTFSSRGLVIPKQGKNYARFYSSSFKPTNFGKFKEGFAKKVLDKPVTAVQSTFSRYSEAIGLQIEAFFKRNYLFLLGAAGVMLCFLLWRTMYGIASTFIGFSEGLAKYGFLALSSAVVAFAVTLCIFKGLYVRSRFTINPDRVYRMAMRRLQTSAGILEVLGPPLTGTDLRAYVMSGGGLTLKKFKPTIRSKRCFIIFPITGSERKGLVSVEVKKKRGKYDLKLLAVDVPMASGPDQRLFLIGDEEEYKVGGGLISMLRDPVVKAMAATKEFDNLDDIEEEEDKKREREEAERKNREEIEKLESSGTQ
ncbi:import inner membrane translocase subunit [Senna tora]|uniref:Import inner membrane translocase subunit n=1 Tax=Senna tora TaxID=362788 RepID=A0A834U244_9FABA|nr:import inner membrane translocase subunit [Senna tora]